MLAVGVDPVRIVPLYRYGGVVAPPEVAAVAPRFVFGGGPLLGAVEVFTVFWGVWWQSVDGVGLASELNGFFDVVLTSALIDQLAEYSAVGTEIGHGKRTGSFTVTAPALDSSIADTSIQQQLQSLIANGSVPATNANTLYFVYLPPGVAVEQGGSKSCQGFCGYHNDINGNVFYAVMPYPGCAGCVGGLTPFEALTSTSSHELCEAITDPIPGQGWYDQTNGEIGDVCAWKTRRLGNYTVQLEWSNQQNRCL